MTLAIMIPKSIAIIHELPATYPPTLITTSLNVEGLFIMSHDQVALDIR